MHSGRQKATLDRLRTGFTLVEILAVVAVGGLLLALLAQVLGGGFSIWSNVHGSLDTEAEARSALGRMGRDLQSFVEPPAGGESFHLVRFPDVEGPAGAEAKHADWLLFISSPLERDMDDPSGVCAVSYRLTYDAIPGRNEESEKRFTLRRRLVASTTTFQEILGTSDLTEKMDSELVAEDEEIVATHIIDFHVTPVFYAAGATRVYRVPDGDAVTAAQRTIVIDGATRPPPGTELGGVEISVTVLRPSGVALVEDGAELATLAPEHISTYSKLVPFPISPGIVR